MAAKGTKDNPYKRSDDAPASVYFRGSNAVKKLEADLGRKLTTEEKRIVALEGYVDGYYKDSKGVLTRGVGQTGDYAKGPHAHSGFNKAFKDHVKRAEKSVPSLNTYSPEARAEIIQAEYRGDLGQGKKFRKKLNAADKVYADPNMLSPYTNYSYKDAATEFLDNKDYKNAKRGRSGVDERMEAVANAVRERGNQNANVSRVPSHLTGLPTLKPREEVITETVTEEGPGFYDRFTSGLKELLPYNEGGTVNKLMNQQEQRPMINSQAMPQPQSQAQGLASLGRGGDSTLVHMQPQEVAGLQQMAQANGTSLTTNPITGYPEAFNLGNMFRAGLPILAGYMTGGAATPFLGAGTATASAITAGAATGAGIAAVSGDDVLAGGLSGGLGGYSGAGLETALAGSAGTVPVTNTGASMMTDPRIAGVSAGTSGAVTGGGALPDGTMGPRVFPQGPTQGPVSLSGGISGAYDQIATNLGNVDPATGVFKDAGGLEVAKTLGSPAVSMGMGGLEESDFYEDVDFSQSDPRDKYNPYSKLNLNNDTGVSAAMRADTGLRLLAEGGSINLNQRGQNLNQRGQNLNQQGQNVNSRGINIGGRGINTSALTNLQGLGSLNVKTGATSASDEEQAILDKSLFKDLGFTGIGGGPSRVPYDYSPGNRISGGANYTTNRDGTFTRVGPAPEDALEVQQQKIRDRIAGSGPTNLNNRGLNLSGKRKFAVGGYLKGPGDGMSDDIPATINGEQPAALADGEFVVPADVVSHLGNGSSEAGSKQLYAMMDRIRKARTGRKSQGKEIKPGKYMPR